MGEEAAVFLEGLVVVVGLGAVLELEEGFLANSVAVLLGAFVFDHVVEVEPLVLSGSLASSDDPRQILQGLLRISVAKACTIGFLADILLEDLKPRRSLFLQDPCLLRFPESHRKLFALPHSESLVVETPAHLELFWVQFTFISRLVRRHLRFRTVCGQVLPLGELLPKLEFWLIHLMHV